MEIPQSVGNYVSQWARDTLVYFAKTDYLTELLQEYFPTRTSFKTGEKMIKNWLRLGLSQDDQDLLMATDIGSPNNQMKNRRNAMIRRLHRLFLRLELEMYGKKEEIENPFDISVVTTNLSEMKITETNMQETPVKNTPPVEETQEVQVAEAEEEKDDEVCFVCLLVTEEKLRVCGHICHKKCRLRLLNRSFNRCGICREPLRIETEQQAQKREYNRYKRDILKMLNDFTYDLDSLKDIYGFLASADDVVD
jgi:hypothetical protein